MTEEEKREFEEFLQWKREKAAKEKQAADAKSDSCKDALTPADNKTAEDTSDSSQDQTPESQGSSQGNGGMTIVTICVLFFIFILMILLGKNCNNDMSYSSEEIDTEIEEVDVDTIVQLVEPADIVPEPRKIEWDFTISTDEMTDTKNIWATIRSDDYIMQDFPYEGRTYASITVRYMKKYGYDVLIEITQGQINGSSYHGTDYITARFDEGSPKKYYFNNAADGSSDVVFLRSAQDFIKRCKQAKDIKIDVPIYQAGRPVFSFHVDEPLTWREE